MRRRIRSDTRFVRTVVAALLGSLLGLLALSVVWSPSIAVAVVFIVVGVLAALLVVRTLAAGDDDRAHRKTWDGAAPSAPSLPPAAATPSATATRPSVPAQVVVPLPTTSPDVSFWQRKDPAGSAPEPQNVDVVGPPAPPDVSRYRRERRVAQCPQCGSARVSVKQGPEGPVFSCSHCQHEWSRTGATAVHRTSAPPAPGKPRVPGQLGREHLSRPLPVTVANSRSGVQTDLVRCSIFAPSKIMRDETTIIQVHLYLENQFDLVAGFAKDFDQDATHRGFQCLDTEIARGTRIGVHLAAPGLTIDTPTMHVVWRGQPASVQFGVTAPWWRTGTSVIITTMLTVDGVPIGHIKVKLEIGQPTSESDTTGRPVGDVAQPYRKAFISHASEDRAEVLKRVQMLNAVRVGFFHDVLSLRSGDRWMDEIYDYIDQCDLFLLFWSTSAKRSRWVEREVQRAIARKAGNEMAAPEIVPVIIEGPPVPAPPDSLAHLHFNDHILFLLAAEN